MHKFFVGKRSDSQISTDLITAMFRQRHQVFYERLGWDVTSRNGLEQDEFDDQNTVYVIARNLQTREVDASWRLRPTSAPYMLKNTFPQLLGGVSAPNDCKTWEISRFAVRTNPYEGSVSQMCGLSQDLFALTVQYAVDHSISNYVWVTSVGVERLGIKLGYRPERLGPPLRIGKVMSVAGKIGIDDVAHHIAMQRLTYQVAQEAA